MSSNKVTLLKGHIVEDDDNILFEYEVLHLNEWCRLIEEEWIPEDRY